MRAQTQVFKKSSSILTSIKLDVSRDKFIEFLSKVKRVFTMTRDVRSNINSDFFRPAFFTARIFLFNLLNEEVMPLLEKWKSQSDNDPIVLILAIKTLIEEFIELSPSDFFENIKISIVNRLIEINLSLKFLEKEEQLDCSILKDIIIKLILGLNRILYFKELYTRWQSTFLSEFKFFLTESVLFDSDSETKKFYQEITNILYRLHSKYFSKESYEKASMLNYYDFFFNNFHIYFNNLNKSGKLVDWDDQILNDAQAHRFEIRDFLMKNLRHRYFRPISFLDSSAFYMNFTNSAINNFYILRLNTWKSHLFESDAIFVCRICESDIPASQFLNHSMRCLEKRSMRVKLLKMNVDINKVKEALDNLIT